MQGENREPTDAQKADMVLRGHMLSLCSPLWWESERKFVVHSGSMCVVNPNVLDHVRDLVLREYEQQAQDAVHAVSQ